MKLVQIEGDKNSVVITVLQENGEGYTGISSEISKAELLNTLIDEGILTEGETVYYEDYER